MDTGVIEQGLNLLIHVNIAICFLVATITGLKIADIVRNRIK